MKRRWLLVPILILVLVAACCIGANWVFRNEICDGPLALRDMAAILQDARNNPNGKPSEEIHRQALITADSSIWRDLRRWLMEAPGQYQMVLINLEIPISPGDDATVGVQLSNGKAIVCSFYNRTLEGCSEVDKIPWPQERAAEDMKAVLEAARKYPSGEPPRDLSWAGLFTYMRAPRAWEDLQQWMVAASGNFLVEVPPYDEQQCGYVSYAVKAHLSSGKTIACEFEGRIIRSCEEVK